MAEYALRQSADPIGEMERLVRIETFQDPATIRYLQALGVGGGWRCLDVGAGGGSITRWLAAQVGPSGSVLATDLEIGLLRAVEGPTVEVRCHDIRCDPLPFTAFDLVHARLLLLHLPERRDVLRRMVAATRPDGWVVIGDIDFTTARAARSSLAFGRVTTAFNQVMPTLGWDPALGSKLPTMLENTGLRAVEADCYQNYHRGGSPWSAIFAGTVRRLRDSLLEVVSESDLDEVIELFDDPSFAFYSPTIWTAWGRV